jgi:hypothetical protein
MSLESESTVSKADNLETWELFSPEKQSLRQRLYTHDCPGSAANGIHCRRYVGRTAYQVQTYLMSWLSSSSSMMLLFGCFPA